MRGLAPDFVYAVGNDGLIARWDGKKWTNVPSPTRSVLSAVCVVSPEEMYAVGAGRRFLDGQKYKATTAPGIIAIMDKKKAAWLA